MLESVRGGCEIALMGGWVQNSAMGGFVTGINQSIVELNVRVVHFDNPILLFSFLRHPATRASTFHAIAKSHAVVELNGSLDEVGFCSGKRGSSLEKLATATQLSFRFRS